MGTLDLEAFNWEDTLEVSSSNLQKDTLYTVLRTDR